MTRRPPPSVIDRLSAPFAEALTRRCGVRAGHTVLAAVSGGADSLCLLHLLLEFRVREGYPALHVAHLDHSVRGASGRRAAATVGRLCRARRLTCTIEALPPWPNPPSEDALRRVRHRFLERVAGETGADWIALGHHRRDQAETVLWNLARGSGRRGLGGMRAVNGLRIRPLLEFAAEDLRAWLSARRIRWNEDETNRSPAFTRNRVRALIPLLARRVHPAAEANLARAARVMAAEDLWLDALAERRLARLARRRSGSVELDVRLLRRASPPLALRMLRAAARDLSGGRLSLSHDRTQRLARLLESVSGRFDLGGGLRAERIGGLLVLSLAARMERPRRRPRLTVVPGEPRFE
jgi:tRNA(Ile)-lysidine synthase